MILLYFVFHAPDFRALFVRLCGVGFPRRRIANGMQSIFAAARSARGFDFIGREVVNSNSSAPILCCRSSFDECCQCAMSAKTSAALLALQFGGRWGFELRARFLVARVVGHPLLSSRDPPRG